MVTGGDDLDASSKEFFGDLWCDASASGGIFSINDAEIDIVFTFDISKLVDYCFSTGFTDNISKKKNAHLI